MLIIHKMFAIINLSKTFQSQKSNDNQYFIICLPDIQGEQSTTYS